MCTETGVTFGPDFRDIDICKSRRTLPTSAAEERVVGSSIGYVARF